MELVGNFDDDNGVPFDGIGQPLERFGVRN